MKSPAGEFLETRSGVGSRAAGIGSALVYFVGLFFFGFICGGFMGGRVFGGGGMGWDQLADSLGGMAVGVGVAILGGAFLLRRFSVGARLMIGVLAFLAAVAIGQYMNANPLPRPGELREARSTSVDASCGQSGTRPWFEARLIQPEAHSCRLLL